MYTTNNEGYQEDTPQGQGLGGNLPDYTTKGDFLRLVDNIKQCWFDGNIVHNLDAFVEFADENDAWDDNVSGSYMRLVYVVLLIISASTGTRDSTRLPAIKNMGKFYSFVKERCEDHYRQGTLNLYDLCLKVSRDVWEIIDQT